MANTIKPKRSYTASNTPTLASGEVGVNAADGKIWIGNAAGNANVLVSSLAFSDHTGTVSNTQLSTTAVTAGSYTNSSITVNAQGRITAASSGTASGTVTSIATTSPITGGTITSTGTIGINAASANTASYVVQRDASGNFSAGTITATLSGNASTATSATSATSATTATNIAGGGAGQLPYNTGSGATSFLAAGTSGQVLTSAGTSAPTWSSLAIPTGALCPYAGSTAPTGYLLCDGSSVSSSTYLALHAVISNTYGGSAYTGAGALNFNLPDLRGRIPMGAGTGTGLNASGTGAPTGTAQTARTAGQWGGEETNLLSTTEMPSHNHGGATQGGGSHSHTPSGSIGNAGISTMNLAVAGGSQWGFTSTATITNTVANHTHNIDAQGGGGRHNNVPPFVVLNYIIKT